MDKIRQYQEITNIKPQYQKLTHPFHKTSMIKIKFLTKEYELQYNDIGVWESDTTITSRIDAIKQTKSKTIDGGSFDTIIVSDLVF